MGSEGGGRRCGVYFCAAVKFGNWMLCVGRWKNVGKVSRSLGVYLGRSYLALYFRLECSALQVGSLARSQLSSQHCVTPPSGSGSWGQSGHLQHIFFFVGGDPSYRQGVVTVMALTQCFRRHFLCLELWAA